ncbi:Right handed beta helix region [Geodermatophilus saharensis]|uniref:Right handed beta helix region n=1 Tax=Geodermatophilus saharensis TaxID=1137994 RepID=A0A239I993_9ACTN|nr:glycosyl hydrolase family 28-related protein [Geodermatophilus saharensis]SNS90396.1 Right handed beta helix region [Geodermatophilus saharensis]
MTAEPPRTPEESAPAGRERWHRRDLLLLGGGVGAAGLVTAGAVGLGRRETAGPAEPAGPVDVRDHGATGDGVTDDTAALQAAVDGAAGRVVRFPAGTYLVSQLLLPSGTSLDLGTAVLRRHANTGGGAGGTTVRNADLERGNSDITILGGVIEGGTDATGRLLGFRNAERVHVSGVHLRKGDSSFVDWVLVLERCDDVHVSDVRITGGQEIGEDGLHIAASSRVTVVNCTIASGDDALSLVQEYEQDRPIRDITVSNCVLSSRSAHMIRVSVLDTETEGIDGVVLTNIAGRAPEEGSFGNPVLVEDQSGRALIRRVTVDNVVVDATGTAGTAWTVRAVRDSSFRGIRVVGASDRSFLVEDAQDLVFTDCHATGPRPDNGNPAWSLLGCRDTVLVGCSASGAPVHGFDVRGGSTGVRLVACTSVDHGAYGFFLSDAPDTSLVACTARGGVEGIHCDTGAPPQGLLVSGCRVVGQSGQALNAVPAGSLLVGNPGVEAPDTRPRGGGEPAVGTVTGRRSDASALTSLLSVLAAQGLIIDGTTA